MTSWVGSLGRTVAKNFAQGTGRWFCTSPSSRTNITPVLCDLRSSRPISLLDLSSVLTPYSAAWELQKRAQQQIMQQTSPDVLLLVQHPPVYTMGRRADEADLGQARGCEVHRVERGGEVTHHCPGQLVGYPVLDLQYYKRDCHWYLRQLEEVIIRVLAEHALEGRRHPSYTGVWVGDAKVAAIGVSVSRWVTLHGFALNVDCDLEGFHRIVPCGIRDPAKSVASLQGLIGRHVAMEVVRVQVLRHFQAVFNVSYNTILDLDAV
jgi:lipoyl(octanoyl) transferase